MMRRITCLHRALPGFVAATIATLATMLAGPAAAGSETVRIASKNFTESYILAEIAAQHLEHLGFQVERRFGLGGTKVCFDALTNDAIDVYPEYSGTINEAILNDASDAPLNSRLATLGLKTLAGLGFNNTYVLAVRRSIAEQRNLRQISDLRGAQGLNVALSHEFRARKDGWPALATHYDLSLPTSGIEHGLAYQALTRGSIDMTDAYSTDGELADAALTLLEDDREFFPRYDALWLARTTLAPDVAAALQQLSGRIDETRMQAMNAAAAVDGESIAAVAAQFLAEEGLVEATAGNARSGIGRSLLRNTLRHLQLTLAALALAAIVGITLALLLQPYRRTSGVFLYVCGLLQTIPSIALLALMIPLFGIGVGPAVVALFLYALLPVVRSTLTAANAIDPVHLTVAEALGMNAAEKRRYVLIPLSMPHIIAGLRTAAVISIGTATLAAFIGAGGLGQPIVTGLALNDSGLILQGAIPAALLAIITDLGFDALERRLVPAHLRDAATSGR